MDELTMLLEEKSNIKKKISETMKDLKNWFTKKKEDVKDYLDTIKDKIIESKEDVTDNRNINKDIIVNNNVVFKKGTSVSKVFTKISSLMRDLKDEIVNVIIYCKEGISSILSNNYENAIHCKKLILSNLKKIALIGTIIVSGIGGITLSNKVNVNQLNSRLTDQELKRLVKNRKEDIIDFQLNVISKKRQDDEYLLNKQIKKAKSDAKIKNKDDNSDTFNDLMNRKKRLDEYIKKTNDSKYDPHHEERLRKREISTRENDEYHRRINEKRDREDAERLEKRSKVAKDVDAYKKKYGVL